MGKFGDVTDRTRPEGWLQRRLREIDRQIQEMRAERRVQASAVEEGTDFKIRGLLSVIGHVIISGGGNLIVEDQGGIQAEYADGTPSTYFGPLQTLIGNPAHGLAVLTENGTTVLGAFRILPTVDDPDGSATVQVGSLSTPAGLFQVEADQVTVNGVTGAQVTGPNFARVFMENNGLELRGGIDGVGAGDRGVRIQHTTTASAANCHIDATTGRIYRSTSSERYKRDIAPADVDTAAVLALVPRAFRRRDEVEELGDEAPTYVGFVAEEADGLGLDEWVTCDEEGPESFDYATFCVAQQAVLREQAAEIQDLRTRLARLEQAN